MQRVSRSTAVAALPAPPAGGMPGYFAKPDPAGGIAATTPGYEWYNAVQEELMAVIEGAGLAAEGADYTQLRRAISKMIQGAQRSVVVSGAVFAPAVTGTGKAVYWDAANSRFDLAIADGSVKQAAVGFADVPNAAVVAFGDATLFSGLTPGARYYVDGTTAGAITTTPPANAVFVGVARTATEMFVDVDLVTPSVPDATTTVKGKVQLATAAQVQAGTDAEKVVTPATLAAAALIGVGQTWQDVTASRAAGTTYTNTAWKPIQVSISLVQAANVTTPTTLMVGGVVVGKSCCNRSLSADYSTLSAIVPAGATYLLTLNGASTVSTWSELR